MKRSIRTTNLEALGEGDSSTKEYQHRSVVRNVSAALITQYVTAGELYSAREVVLEQVGGHSKEGVGNIQASAELWEIYTQVCADTGLPPWIEPLVQPARRM